MAFDDNPCVVTTFTARVSPPPGACPVNLVHDNGGPNCFFWLVIDRSLRTILRQAVAALPPPAFADKLARPASCWGWAIRSPKRGPAAERLRVSRCRHWSRPGSHDRSERHFHPVARRPPTRPARQGLRPLSALARLDRSRTVSDRCEAGATRKSAHNTLVMLGGASTRHPGTRCRRAHWTDMALGSGG